MEKTGILSLVKALTSEEEFSMLTMEFIYCPPVLLTYPQIDY